MKEVEGAKATASHTCTVGPIGGLAADRKGRLRPHPPEPTMMSGRAPCGQRRSEQRQRTGAVVPALLGHDTSQQRHALAA